ncbi:hypothetical protein V2J09_021200 [Rumex salicifolius]
MKRGPRRSTNNGRGGVRSKLKLTAGTSNTKPLKDLLSQVSFVKQPRRHEEELEQPPPQKKHLTSLSCSRFQKKLLDSDSSQSDNGLLPLLPPSKPEMNLDSSAAAGDDKDFILSQDFFCTPDYITPECQNFFSNMDCNKVENLPCPESPEKIKITKNKISKREVFIKSPESHSSDHQQIEELSKDVSSFDEIKPENTVGLGSERNQNYVSQSAVALRCRVMPPPCIKNPYLKFESNMDVDPFDSWRTKCPGYVATSFSADSLSRYRSDFQEIEQIGYGNFSRVFKVLKRIDGCMYAVKHTTRQLHQDAERTKALMEVQALAALGFHENVVAYYCSWFENEKLYIQMELCDYSLSISSNSLPMEEEVLRVMLQIAKALQYVHEKGMAHLDVKPDNIYVKNGVYKLGDFGCATLLDRNLPIEEGDARYMPREILNEKYDNLDKVDIYSLGVSIYELIQGSSCLQFINLREGKIPLLPTHSMQLQNLLRAMVDPDPTRRPSAKELLANPIFSRFSANSKIK